MPDIGKTRGRREYMCRPHYREIPGGRFGCFPRLRGMCMEQMEDGFGEALLSRERLDSDGTACYSGRVSQVPDEVSVVRLE